jgi:AcrR family transcriptional regulator
MPRGFSEKQMLLFRQKIIDAAFEALKNNGMRKTTVGELAKTAKLSTGAFYKFFPSKEALFFQVYELSEAALKNEFTSWLQMTGTVSADSLGLTLKQLFRSDAMQSLLQLIQKDELEYLVRNIDPSTVEHHLQKDRAFLQSAIDQLQVKGLMITNDANQLIAYLQALLILCYEQYQYPEYADQIIDAFIDTLIANAIE